MLAVHGLGLMLASIENSVGGGGSMIGGFNTIQSLDYSFYWRVVREHIELHLKSWVDALECSG